MELEYIVLLMIVKSSKGPEMTIFGGCVKFHTVAFFKIQNGRRHAPFYEDFSNILIYMIKIHFFAWNHSGLVKLHLETEKPIKLSYLIT